jgi:hypothetical protein
MSKRRHALDEKILGVPRSQVFKPTQFSLFPTSVFPSLLIHTPLPSPSLASLFVDMKVSTLAPLILSPVAIAASRHTLRQASLKRGLVDVCVGLDLDVKLLDILPDSKSI